MITAQYGTDAFQELIEGAATAVNEDGHACIVAVGSDEESWRSVISELADYAGLDVTQRDAAALIGERPEQSHGNIREAFDTAGDGASILVFTNADALYDASRKQREEDELDDDARTVTDYLNDRIGHKTGITVLHLTEARNLGEAQNDVADAVVKL